MSALFERAYSRKKYTLPLASLDSETTGTDFTHGCAPFMFTACDEDLNVYVWEWDVDPKTREVQYNKKDLKEIQKFLNKHSLVLHNTKFDFKALKAAGLEIPDFDKVDDTLIASHICASADSHDLKDLAVLLLDLPDEDEKALQEAITSARRIAKKLGWRLAKRDDPHFPALKNATWWKMDMWLPRAVAKHYNYPPDHPWWTICRQYARFDAERTLGVWMVLQEELEERKLWDIYQVRRKLLEITWEMETQGISVNPERLKKQKKGFKSKACIAEKTCKKLGGRHLTNLNSSQQIQRTLFEEFGLEPVKKTKTGLSVDADVLEELSLRVDPNSDEYDFLTSLQDQRAYVKAIEYLEGYQKFGMLHDDWLWLYPTFNITGTRTTRFSGQYPNMQNVSKQKKINLRWVFGPASGREWWSLDYSNIEMRIFAYSSGDERLIEAFEQGQSVHLIFAEILHPKEYAACLKAGQLFKDLYEDSLYQWTKNGNFALIYGAGVRKADLTYRVKGAYDLIRKNLPLIDQFMRQKDQEARKTGYIITRGGYPLQVPEKRPHVAVNYYIQGSAGWVMINAMIRVREYLRQLPGYRMIMTIHDELVFDFPKHDDPAINLKVIQDIKRIMESAGDTIGIPTPVDVERHANNWAEGERLKLAA